MNEEDIVGQPQDKMLQNNVVCESSEEPAKPGLYEKSILKWHACYHHQRSLIVSTFSAEHFWLHQPEKVATHSVQCSI